MFVFQYFSATTRNKISLLKLVECCYICVGYFVILWNVCNLFHYVSVKTSRNILLKTTKYSHEHVQCMSFCDVMNYFIDNISVWEPAIKFLFKLTEYCSVCVTHSEILWNVNNLFHHFSVNTISVEIDRVLLCTWKSFCFSVKRSETLSVEINGVLSCTCTSHSEM